MVDFISRPIYQSKRTSFKNVKFSIFNYESVCILTQGKWHRLMLRSTTPFYKSYCDMDKPKKKSIMKLYKLRDYIICFF